MNKKRNIVEWAMHYRQIVILITAILVAFGIFALNKMNKNEFPDFTVRQGVVAAVYPGASVTDMEQQVTKPLENYIFTYKEVKKDKTKSFTRNGLTIIQVELNDDISASEMQDFWSRFKLGVQQFKLSLPQGVLALQVQDDFGEASSLLITMESNQKTYRELNTYMDNLKERLRNIESVGRLNVYGGQQEQISIYGNSVTNFLKELLIAIIAVVVVVVLLLPLRVALVAASTIPVSIFISLGLFYAFGIELNTVTLAALIVTLGMIVDNSIVIIDNYMELLAEGMSRWKASIKSANHFFKSILSATLAISLTFFPLLLTMTGMYHDFLLFFPWGITIVLLVSLIVAELLTPFLQFYFIREPIKERLNKDGKPRFSFLPLMQAYYDKLVDFCFRHPYGVMAAAGLSVIIGGVLFVLLPQKMMPTAERNQFAVEIYLPTGTALQKTEHIADSLEHILRKDPRVVSIASFKGTASPRFQTSYAPQFGGKNYAQFIVNTKGSDATLGVLHDYRMKYTAAFPGAYVRFKQLNYSAEGNSIEIRLTGDNWQQLHQTADSITSVLRADNRFILARNDVNEPLLTTNIRLDEQKANRLGINNALVELTMATRYNESGIPLTTIWDSDYGIPVTLKGNKADSSTMADVANEPIPVAGGLKTVPLRQIATVTPPWEDGQICHRNGRRTITIMADVADGINVMKATTDLQKQIKPDRLPDGISMQWGGEYEQANEANPQIVGGLAISVAVIFFLMLAHFRRISTALLLLASLSLIAFGTAMGVLLPGSEFSLTCYLGVISLMGILIRNALIMFDYAEELRETEHLTAHEAILLSAKRRMRPIFLTSAAASMGVIPMMLGGSGLWAPMANVIFFGTMITMFFILTVLPISYWLLMSGSTAKRQQSTALENQ